MGNRLCKKKNDTVDGNHPKSTPFVRIMSRMKLKPRWKSDSHLEQKQVNRYEVPPLNGSLPKHQKQLPPSKSSDWTDVNLEVPEDEEIQLKNSKLTFSNELDGTPQPPPRKNKKGIREKIEAVAKSGLQALQPRKPVDEPLFVKKTINYDCPCGYHGPKENHNHVPKTSTPKISHKFLDRDAKRKKNLSVVSLPNYTELKFSVANNGENIDKTDSELRKSVHSLPGETKKITVYPEKKDYITRCRSFGSSLPQLLLHKLTNAKAPLAEIESDDSFGGLEDWDLKIIEHYNPKDSSLPRNTKPLRTDLDVLNDLESLIVQDEDIEPPRPPVRRSESLVKKINKTAAETARKISNTNENRIQDGTPTNATPPPSPERIIKDTINRISLEDLPTEDEDGNIEHSSLLKILQDYSIRDAQAKNTLNNTKNTRVVESENTRNLSSRHNDLDINKNQEIAVVATQKSINNNKTPIVQTPVYNRENSNKNSYSYAVDDFLKAERHNLTLENLNRLQTVDIHS